MRFGDVTVDRDVAMAAPDGTILRADVWRPAGAATSAQRLPALLSRQPYGKAQAQALTYAHPAWYARHGYAVVVQDVRGRWGSDGDFVPYVHEAADGAAAVAWCAEQPWCDGQVGMWGFSYAGATQLLAAGEQPPGLRAIVPTHTGCDFADGWTFRGGALEHAFVLPWAAFLAADTARRAGDAPAMAALLHAADHPDALLDAHPLGDLEALRTYAPWLSDWLRSDAGGGGEPWVSTRVADRWDAIDVAALHVAGWFDSFLEGGLRNYAALRGRDVAEQRLLVGPWGHIPWGRHVGAWSFGADTGPWTVDTAQLAFFDRHLRAGGDGVATGAIVMRGAGEWLPVWPPPGARTQTLWLHSDGRANTAAGDGTLRGEPPAGAQPCDLVLSDPAAPVPSAGGHSCCFEEHAPVGPAHQGMVESLHRVLCFTGEPVAVPTLLAGCVEVVLFAQTDAPDGDVTAKLCLVDADGHSFNVVEGIARLRRVLAPGTPVAGAVHELRLTLGSTCVRLAPGERLRVQVAASDFPRFDRNLQTGAALGVGTLVDAVIATLAIHHEAAAPSRVELPVLEGGWA